MPLLRRKSLPFLAVMGFWMIAGFLAMFMATTFAQLGFVAATLCVFGYMGWCIRNATKRDSMPQDPSLGRGPDPFLSRRRRVDSMSARKPANRH
jgi:hypothetical protein